MPGGGSPGRYRSKPKTRAAPSSALPLRVDLLTAQIAEGANGSQEQSSQKWLSDLLCEAPVYLEAKPLSVRPMPPALFWMARFRQVWENLTEKSLNLLRRGRRGNTIGWCLYLVGG